jgi:hypothetical protein
MFGLESVANALMHGDGASNVPSQSKIRPCMGIDFGGRIRIESARDIVADVGLAGHDGIL